MPRSRQACLPPGFLYKPEFLSAQEESELIARIGQLEFGEVRMHGVTARRRVVHLGWLYGYESWRIERGPAIPEFLLGVRARAAAQVEVEPDALAEALVTEYPPGAGIGWHRDAPPFGIVAAVSLGASCRMRFRRGAAGSRETAEIEIAPRSFYAITGEARSAWQHGIPATPALRYSVTFRTLSKPRAE